MREWWIRTLLVLQSPRAVFVALRGDSSEAAEPVLAIVLLAGIASLLPSRAVAHVMDNHSVDGLLAAIYVFLFGSLYGAFAYWAFGAVLHGGVRVFGSRGTYKRTRHVLAFAAVPLALSLVLWPVKLALYGEDVFRRGGSDRGGGAEAFTVLELGFAVWALALLVIGVRAVHGWTWPRAGAAIALALAVPAVIALAAGGL